MTAAILAFPAARKIDREAERAAYAAKVAEAEAQDTAACAAIGPWFADVVCAVSGERYNVRDTVEAKIIRRCLREIAGVAASVTVRRYSMASGLDLRGPFTSAQAKRIAEVFPGMAWMGWRWNDEGTERTEDWTVGCGGIYPHARRDESDLLSDYHRPGGFRVANEHLIAVSAIVSAVVNGAR